MFWPQDAIQNKEAAKENPLWSECRGRYTVAMVDKLTGEHRSWLMSRIRSKDTKPELIVRSMLHRCGYRFSLTRADLPGKPDIVMPKHGTVVFVHGCFWHQHKGCKNAKVPKSSRWGLEKWREKFGGNVARDEKHRRKLRKLGWRVIVVWECQVMRDPEKVLRRIAKHLAGRTKTVYAIPPRRTILKAAESRLQYSLRQRTQISRKLSATPQSRESPRGHPE